jgi:hypothetical protein
MMKMIPQIVLMSGQNPRSVFDAGGTSAAAVEVAMNMVNDSASALLHWDQKPNRSGYQMWTVIVFFVYLNGFFLFTFC